MAPYRTVRDLPEKISVFPLPGVMLFPRWELPLNIFEPRYLNMIDDAMRSDRMIGMIQSVGGPKAHPQIAGTGCAGWITRYSETNDGRYLITLTGICRFRVAAELDVKTPYRKVTPDWQPFAADLQDRAEVSPAHRIRLLAAFGAFMQAQGYARKDWAGEIEPMPAEQLVHSLAAAGPFTPAEKQALLEAGTLEDRSLVLSDFLYARADGGKRGSVE